VLSIADDDFELFVALGDGGHAVAKFSKFQKKDSYDTIISLKHNIGEVEGSPCAKNQMCSCCDTIPACDRHTQTDTGPTANR